MINVIQFVIPLMTRQIFYIGDSESEFIIHTNRRSIQSQDYFSTPSVRADTLVYNDFFKSQSIDQ